MSTDLDLDCLVLYPPRPLEAALPRSLLLLLLLLLLLCPLLPRTRLPRPLPCPRSRSPRLTVRRVRASPCDPDLDPDRDRDLLGDAFGRLWIPLEVVVGLESFRPYLLLVGDFRWTGTGDNRLEVCEREPGSEARAGRSLSSSELVELVTGANKVSLLNFTSHSPVSLNLRASCANLI